MAKLRILEILKEQNHTRYWLFKKMEMTNYKNFHNIIENHTTSIRFDILDKLSQNLNVPVGELFEKDPAQSDGKE